MATRGRPRTRDVEKWNEIERDYMTKYVRARRNDPNDCYKMIQSRCYYKRVLKNMDVNDKKYDKTLQKITELDTKIKEIQAKRINSQPQNII